MIRIGSELLPPHLPSTPRGFAWWYADIVGGAGDAVVLLWARRLPFVPVRPDGDEAPLAVALAVYRNGRECFYALQTRAEREARESPGELRIGDSCFRVRSHAGRVSLRADLDLLLPASGRVTGVVELEGARTTIQAGSESPLDWFPITATALGRASLDWEGGSCDVVGRGYFDGNAAAEPLHELGIADWRWGRVSFPSREVVYFQVSPASGDAPPTVLSISKRGDGRAVAGATSELADAAPGWFGLRRAERLALSLPGERIEVQFQHQVEDGFFYQRYLTAARSTSGETGHGVAERVAPSRLASSWHRPLVRMRVDQHGLAPSRWYPLFSGARAGRWSRLLASWGRPGGQVTT